MITAFGRSAHITNDDIVWGEGVDPLYVSPEIDYRGKMAVEFATYSYEFRAYLDWWSAAVVLYEMVTGSFVSFPRSASCTFYA